MPAPDAITIYPIPGFSEPVSCFTHLLGASVFLVLGIVLVRRDHGHWGRVAALGTFAFGSVFLLSTSGIYHLLAPHGAPRAVLQRLDHAAIFFVIAGTLTAVLAILFTGRWRWGSIAVLWAITASAITLKTIFFDRVPEGLGLALYLGLAWLGAILVVRIHRRFGWRIVRPLVLGGLAYTIGAVLEYLRRPVLIEGVVGPHELFHFAVLAGLAWHWRFLYRFSARFLPERSDLDARPTPAGERTAR
jgi:channel protein (hemolysin III family)